MRRIRIWKETVEPSFPPDRVWKVSHTKADTRQTQWPSHAEAIEWATMDPVKQKKIVDREAEMEGGW